MVIMNAPRVLSCLLLLLLLSTLCIRNHSVDVSSAHQEIPATADTAIITATEKRDDKWEEQVARNRRFLTRKSRESLRRELEIRNRRIIPEEEEQQQSQQQLNEQQQQQQQQQRQLKPTGQVVLNVLVCLMQWTNHPDRDKAVAMEDYQAMFSNDGRDETLYPGGTLKDWFHTMSYGNFTMNFEVTPWIMTNYTEQEFNVTHKRPEPTANGTDQEYTKQEDIEWKKQKKEEQNELQRAFAPVLEYLDNDFYNFTKIDLTIFLHSGYDGSINGTDCETGKTQNQRVASHARKEADISEWVSSSGYKLGAYLVSSNK